MCPNFKTKQLRSWVGRWGAKVVRSAYYYDTASLIGFAVPDGTFGITNNLNIKIANAIKD